MTAGITALFLLGPLVVVPLGLRLIPSEDDPLAARLATVGTRWSQPAGGLLAIAFLLPAGVAAGVLAIPWLLIAASCAGAGAIGVLRQPMPFRPGLRQATAAARTFLAVGAAFAVTDRLGLRPFDFTATIILLTAVHFHFAGFALVLAGALAWRARPSRALRIAVGVLIAGIPLTALGFFGLPVVAWVGVALVASSAIVVGLGTVAISRQMPRRAAAPAILAGLALLVSMPLALTYTTGTLVGLAWLDIPTMASIHGTLNALGFAIPVMIAWTIETRRGS